jgi:hypothetical protein
MLAAWPSWASGQDVNPAHQQTTPPPNARFEIVQSPLAARWTFRLERYSGRVSQIVSTADDYVTWEDMEVIGLPTIQAAAKPRFQIFTSGIAARHTFLLDTETGNTWRVVADKRKSPDGTEYEVYVWQPFAK